MSKSTSRGGPDKPAKPYPEFPLFPHATKRWAKKIKGHMVYFGPWADPDGALAKYLEEKDDLYAGRRPRRSAGELTVRDLCNTFLTSKRRLVDSGERTLRTFDTYYRTCKRIVEHFSRDRLVSDLRPDDFGRLRAEMARRYGPVTLRSRMQVVRVVFNFAVASGLTDRPVNYGQEFQKPSKKTLRLAKAEQGLRMFESHELRRTLDAATLTHRAMILLGVNAGLGNTDVGRMRFSHIDLDAGWLNYPRQKTGVVRRCPLWPETVAAVRAALLRRPKPKDEADADLVFLTRRGTPYVNNYISHEDGPEMTATITDCVGVQTWKLLRLAGVARPGLSFYALRHTFETIGGESRDQVAVDFIMGHSKGDMASEYRERISDERLKAVTDHVREWLFPPKRANAKEQAGPTRLVGPRKADLR